MKKIIVANWKMNPYTLRDAKQLLNNIKKGLTKIKFKNIEVIICAPFIWLSDLSNSPSKKIKLGAQNLFWEKQGAYTGEISGLMLRNLKCQYVLIGHSERRTHLNETNKMINKKIMTALSVFLKPILCVGEKRGEDMSQVIRGQLIEGLKGVSRAKAENLIIAYEPVWAIGTGNPCKPEDAMKASLFIRKILSDIYNRKIADKIPIIYGGSTNSKNAKNYITEAEMDGLLPGGASLDASEFIRMIKEVNKNV